MKFGRIVLQDNRHQLTMTQLVNYPKVFLG